MAAEFIAGLGAIKTAFDMAKGLKDIDDATRRNAAVIELQEKILTAQAAQAALVETVSELKARVGELENWEAEKQRYGLIELTPGMFAMAIKESMRGSEPSHLLCANCFNGGKKSFLQQQIRGSEYQRFACNACKEELGFSTPGGSKWSGWKPMDPRDWT